MATLLLQPTMGQGRDLERMLSAQRELYNAALEERRGAWRLERRRVKRLDQYGELTGWDHPVLAYGATPARGTLLRVDRAFDGFFRRLRTGAKPGYPRFKSAARFDSVEYPQAHSWKVEGDSRAGRLYVQGVGHIRYRTSRRGLRGKPKTLVLRREGRRWRAYIACEIEPTEPREPTGKVVGIDVGITNLLATSDGELLRGAADSRLAARIKAAERRRDGRRRGSNRRRKASQALGALRRKEARCRVDRAHQVSRRLVNEYDLIVHEDLKIKNMLRRPSPRPDGEGGFLPNGASAKAGLNRGIQGAGWGLLFRMLSYKVEEAGRELLAVDPRHTSVTCHSCGGVDPNNRDGPEFRCRACGHVDHADLNAARNILRAGLALRLERAA